MPESDAEEPAHCAMRAWFTAAREVAREALATAGQQGEAA